MHIEPRYSSNWLDNFKAFIIKLIAVSVLNNLTFAMHKFHISNVGDILLIIDANMNEHALRDIIAFLNVEVFYILRK